MVDHFHEKVIALGKIGGQARAMVVTNGIERAVQYFHAIRDYLKERKSPYQAIVAFSGEHEFGEQKVTEATLNGFGSNFIADRIAEAPYRILVCADKFQTGYDEPMLPHHVRGQDAVRHQGGGFLASILPYSNASWEKLSIFPTFLTPKLLAPKEENLSQGIPDAIDMDSYRVEKQSAVKIQLPDQNAEIEPVPTSGGGHKPEPELERLSDILQGFNDLFGNIQWMDADRVRTLITVDIPERVAADKAYQNARQNSDKQNARIEHDKALARVIVGLMKDDTQLFKRSATTTRSSVGWEMPCSG